MNQGGLFDGNTYVKLSDLTFYSFFTKYSLMEDYGYSSGILSRVFRKFLPTTPNNNTIEYYLLKNDSVDDILNLLDYQSISNSSIAQELDLSVKALFTKIVAFGLDSNITSKFDYLGFDTDVFETTLDKLNKLKAYNKEEIDELIKCLNKIELLFNNLRKNRHKIGVNFHLTVTTRKVLEYIKRIKELLSLKLNISSKTHWRSIFEKYIEYSKQKNSIRRFARRHADLVILEIVEHTANKGEKYIAENKQEYVSFFYKSLLGGGLISIFALVKIILSSYQLSQISSALFYSINYAVCFVLVKQVGGIIATKQPAVTASTIARYIDNNDDLMVDSINNISELIRKVFKSQFVSIIGNFLMALGFSFLIVLVLKVFNLNKLIDTIKPEYLIKNVLPTFQLIFFASIAGFFLALSGLISGFVDNKIIESKIPYRITNNWVILNSNQFSSFVEKKAGALIGNVSLGFFLGSAFLFSKLFPIAIDIRHIAFSSANVGFAVTNQSFDYSIILLALLGALLIGLVNFVVSFSITLFLTLRSRGVSIKLLYKVIISAFTNTSKKY